MVTTLDIPDDVLQQAKLKAAQEGVTLKEIVARALKMDLARELTPVRSACSPQERFLKLSRTERATAFLEESKAMAEFYAAHPDELIPDFIDEPRGESDEQRKAR
ncbi:MAG TPA: hypothetical protein VKX17_08595 [Planctomycetota bacterium]|nr:hypothetical protein [Planctomycetota bacterium]